VHQANERVLRTSNKIAQKASSFYFTYYIIIIAIYKHKYFFKRQSTSQIFIFSAGVEHLRVVQLESMPGYKYPNIDSGATPIGSAGRAPDRNQFRETLQKEMKKKKLGAYDRLQVPDHSLGGYSHRERRFKNPMILAIAFESQRLKKSKIKEVKD
jgi:hypothetical protein